MGWRESGSNAHFSFIGFVFHALIRFLQLVLALAVIGLYGQYLNNARIQNKYADPNFVYAVVTASLAAVTAVVYLIPFLKTSRFFGWDLVILSVLKGTLHPVYHLVPTANVCTPSILWVGVFGVFGRLFIHEDPEGDSGIQQMKNAVWVDLVNMLLWLITAVYGAVMFFTHRRGQSLHTGRATV